MNKYQHLMESVLLIWKDQISRDTPEYFEEVFDSLERAPWWEEVGVGYAFQTGEPYRVELPSGVASEHTTTHIYTIHTNSQNTYFRDTRWQPPVEPPKVGDLIETVDQAESLPIGTIAVSRLNTPIRKVGIDAWQRVGGTAGPFADRSMAGYGDRIIYLPSEVSE